MHICFLYFVPQFHCYLGRYYFKFSVKSRAVAESHRNLTSMSVFIFNLAQNSAHWCSLQGQLCRLCRPLAQTNPESPRSNHISSASEKQELCCFNQLFSNKVGNTHSKFHVIDYCGITCHVFVIVEHLYILFNRYKLHKLND